MKLPAVAVDFALTKETRKASALAADVQRYKRQILVQLGGIWV